METHHIILLADDGTDRMSNVIALCANDHREAHYGRRADILEREMIEVVCKLEASPTPLVGVSLDSGRRIVASVRP